MPNENVALVQRFEELMLEDRKGVPGSLEKVLELVDEHVVFRVAASMPHGGEWVGHEGFLKMWEIASRAWDHPGTVNFEYLACSGDKVVVLITSTLRATETDQSVPQRMVEVITVIDGKITEFTPYYFDTVPVVRTFQ